MAYKINIFGIKVNQLISFYRKITIFLRTSSNQKIEIICLTLQYTTFYKN